MTAWQRAIEAWAAEDPEHRTGAAIGEAIGVTGQAVGAWRAGTSEPRDGNALRLRTLGIQGPTAIEAVPVADLERIREQRKRFERLAKAVKS